MIMRAPASRPDDPNNQGHHCEMKHGLVVVAQTSDDHGVLDGRPPKEGRWVIPRIQKKLSLIKSTNVYVNVAPSLTV